MHAVSQQAQISSPLRNFCAHPSSGLSTLTRASTLHPLRRPHREYLRHVKLHAIRHRVLTKIRDHLEKSALIRVTKVYRDDLGISTPQTVK